MYSCPLEAGNRRSETKAVIVFDVLIPVLLDQKRLIKLHKLLATMWDYSSHVIETEWIMHRAGLFPFWVFLVFFGFFTVTYEGQRVVLSRDAQSWTICCLESWWIIFTHTERKSQMYTQALEIWCWEWEEKLILFQVDAFTCHGAILFIWIWKNSCFPDRYAEEIYPLWFSFHVSENTIICSSLDRRNSTNVPVILIAAIGLL